MTIKTQGRDARNKRCRDTQMLLSQGRENIGKIHESKVCQRINTVDTVKTISAVDSRRIFDCIRSKFGL